ncbi:MAG: ATP-binding protein [Nitrospirota bacterium]
MGRAEDLFRIIEEKGDEAIREFIETRKSEELFLDFKQSASERNATNILHEDDRKNLAKAISGFGNSEGGIIVWGVECRSGKDNADVAKCKQPIKDVKRFVSWLEGAVSGCTVPIHAGVRSIAVETVKGQGFAITLIPKSLRAPHQDIYRTQYYMRAGSDFKPVPHSVLAGMFGRRPEPNMRINYNINPNSFNSDNTISGSVGFCLTNDGPGIAKDVFLCLTVISPSNEPRFVVDRSDMQNFTGIFSYGIHWSTISADSFKLPPDGKCQPLTLHYALKPPFNNKLYIKIVYGADGTQTSEYIFEKSIAKLNEIYSETMKLKGTEEGKYYLYTKLFDKIPLNAKKAEEIREQT